MPNLQARLCFELAFDWQSCSNTLVRNKNKEERWFVDERQNCLLQSGVPHTHSAAGDSNSLHVCVLSEYNLTARA